MLGIIYSISESSPHAYFLFAQQTGQSYLCSRPSSELNIDTGDTLTDVTVWSGFFSPPRIERWHHAVVTCFGHTEGSENGKKKERLQSPFASSFVKRDRLTTGSWRERRNNSTNMCYKPRVCAFMSNRRVIEGNAASKTITPYAINQWLMGILQHLSRLYTGSSVWSLHDYFYMTRPWVNLYSPHNGIPAKSRRPAMRKTEHS